MVTIIRRMRKLRSLLDIRIGPGAALISNDVKRIHLKFARKINDGHRGPRKFWHNHLPRLKYHNPAIPMTVELTDDQEGPASLTISFATPSSVTPPPSAPISSTSTSTASSDDTPVEHTRSINMKHKKESEILAELLKMTNGKPIIATAEEEAQLKSFAEQDARSEADRLRHAEFTKAKKREAELFERAKQVGS